MRSLWRLKLLWLMTALIVCGGCQNLGNQQLSKRLMAYTSTRDRAEILEKYAVSHPDVVRLTVPGQKPWTGTFAVEPDGSIHLANGKSLPVEGQTVRQIRKELAGRFQLPEKEIQVEVTEHKSQKLFVHGEVKGSTQVVAYKGPETAVMLLERLGGITDGAVTTDIQIVRARIAEGESPEIFRVDLNEVLMDKKKEKDPQLHPFDQIYVSETRRSSLEKSLPKWLRPLYATLVGLEIPEPKTLSPRLPFRRAKVKRKESFFARLWRRKRSEKREAGDERPERESE